MPVYTIHATGTCTFTAAVIAKDAKEAWNKVIKGADDVEWEVDADSEEINELMPGFETEDDAAYFEGNPNGEVEQLEYEEYGDLQHDGHSIAADPQGVPEQALPFVLPSFEPMPHVPVGIEKLSDAEVKGLYRDLKHLSPVQLQRSVTLLKQFGLKVSSIARLTQPMREAFIRERFTLCGHALPYTHVLRVQDGLPVLVPKPQKD